MPLKMLRKSSWMSLYGVQRLYGAKGGFGSVSSGRGLIVVENEEVNAEESRQVYVPCIWKAVSIYSSHKTKPEGSKVLSTLHWVTLGFLDIAIGAFSKCDEEFPGGPDSHGYCKGR